MTDTNQLWRDIHNAEQRLAGARRAGDQEEQADMLLLLGCCYHDLRQPADAVGYLEQALPPLRLLQNREGELLALQMLASCLQGMEDISRALAVYEEGLALARAHGDQVAEFDCLYGLGMSAFMVERGATSISHLLHALPIARRMGDPVRELHTLGGLGNAYALVGSVSDAISSFEQARALARGCGDLEGEAYQLGNLGTIYVHSLGQPEVGLGYYEQALAIFQQLADGPNTARTLVNRGRAQAAMGQSGEALRSMEQARALATQLGDRGLLGDILSELAEIQEMSGDVISSVQSHARAVEVTRGQGEGLGHLHGLNSAGIGLRRTGPPGVSLKLHREALALARAARDPLAEAKQLGNIALTLDKMGYATNALLCHRQALLLFQLLGDVIGEGLTFVYMGMGFYRQDSLIKCLACWRVAQQVLQGRATREGQLLPATLEDLRSHLGEAPFQRASKSSEHYARWLAYERHWSLLMALSDQAEGHGGLDPCLVATGEPVQVLRFPDDLPLDWLEAGVASDPATWHLALARVVEGESRASAPDGPSRAQLLRSLGSAFAMAGYLEEAEQALRLALDEFKARAEKDNIQVALLTLAALALRADRMQEAERFINEALYYTIDLERDEVRASRAAKRMGVAFRMIESPRRALHYLERAGELARAAGNRDDEGWALSALGTANAQFGHTRKALDYHRQALALFRQQGAHAPENEQALRLAGALAIAGQFAEAMKTLEHLQQLTLARGELIPSVQARVSLGIVVLLQGDMEGYLEGLREALELVPEREGRIRERIQRAIAVEPHTKA